MAGSSDYIPAPDADYDLWATNFSTLLTASPGTYGLVAGDATAVAAVYSTWHAAYLAAINPATRTPVTVQAKDVARSASLVVIRPYAVTISNNAGVNPSDKVAIGVNPGTSTPTPIPAPNTAPVISVQLATPLVHQLAYHDESQPETVKAKPDGVKFLELRGAVSVTPITDQAAIAFKSLQSKSPFFVEWDAADVGKQAYYAARWVNSNGLLGPWSAIQQFTVANG